MSRLLLTNVQQWKDIIVESNEKAGLHPLFKKKYDDVYVWTYQKLKVKNINYFINNNDFVCCSGTMFYDGLFNTDALKKLCYDVEKCTIKEIRNRMIGSYMVAIKKGDSIIVFGDETNTYKIYYYLNNTQFIIGNSYYHIAECIGATFNKNALMESFVRVPLGTDSIIKDVKLLSAREALSINLENKSIRVLKCELNDYSRSFNNVEEFTNTIFHYIKHISGVRACYLKKPKLFLTGGVDSRLELATDLLEDIRPIISYWKGSDVITNGSDRDLQIAREIAEHKGLSFVLHDVSESFSEALENISKTNNKYGEYSSIYSGNRKWYDIFETLEDVDSIELGAFGEILRELSALDNSYHKGYKLEDVAYYVIDRGGFGKNIFSFTGREEMVKRHLSSYFPIANPNDLSIEEAFKLFSCTRFGGDVSIYNLANLFVYSFPICAQKQIVDTVFSVPYDWLKDSKIVIMLIEKMRSDLLGIPFYSHHRDYIYDRRSHTVKESLKFSLLDRLKPFIVNTKLYEVLYLKIAHRIIRPLSADNDYIFESALSVIENSPTLKSMSIKVNRPKNWRSIDVAGLAVLAANLYSLDILKDRLKH